MTSAERPQTLCGRQNVRRKRPHPLKGIAVLRTLLKQEHNRRTSAEPSRSSDERGAPTGGAPARLRTRASDGHDLAPGATHLNRLGMAGPRVPYKR